MARNEARAGIRLAVSIGCPCGIGPEVAIVAAAKASAHVLLVGDVGVLRAAARLYGIDPKRLVVTEIRAKHSNGARIGVRSSSTSRPNDSTSSHEDQVVRAERQGAPSSLGSTPPPIS
jgi:4-hydroxy-L-threonine phosphate dehydrogenase PdxA